MIPNHQFVSQCCPQMALQRELPVLKVRVDAKILVERKLNLVQSRSKSGIAYRVRPLPILTMKSLYHRAMSKIS